MNVLDAIDILAPYDNNAHVARHNFRALITNLNALCHHSKCGRRKGVGDARKILFLIIEQLASEYEVVEV